jgi:transmembrane sensor
MDSEGIIYLYTRIKSKEGTAAEEQEFDLLLKVPANQEILKKHWDQQWNAACAEDQSKIYIANEQKILADILANSRQEIAPVKLWPRIVAVAAAVAAITLGVWFYTSRHLEGDPSLRSGQAVELLNYANDIAPGKNTATLTLANGKTINLSDAKTGVVVGEELKYNDGTDLNGRHPEFISGSPPQQLTATTPRGGTYQVTLPDGTKVWLNADSKLEFPSKFGKNEQRIVRLSGEGYFEVSKDKAHPFVVQTDKQEVTVLGTHFNISAYRDEVNTMTTLLEGSVKVSSFLAPPSSRGKRSDEGSLGHANSRDSSIPRNNVVLKPSQQSVVSGYDRIAIANVDVSDIVDWKNGDFVFRGESLEVVMRKLARWYNIDVVYESGAPKNLILGAYLSRFRPISVVLERLEKTGKVKFKIEGKKIVVMKQ